MKRIIYIIILAFLFGSCEKFVDILPKGKNIPSTVDDLAKILNENNNIGGGGMNWFYMSSDVLLLDYQLKSSDATDLNAYMWAPYQFTKMEKDPDWAQHYMIIYYANYVIEHIKTAPDGMDFNREETYARALLHRAYSYWYMVNAYAPFYNKATAATDLSVPMPVVSDINKQYPRSTVQQVYDQILQDINDAIAQKGLSDWRLYNSWPCRAAAYALLSRIYLYQKDWEKATRYGEEAMKINSYLNDLNEITMSDPTNAAKGLKGYEAYIMRDKETVLSKTAGNNFVDVMSSEELVNCYDKARDLRFRFFFSNKTRYEVALDGYMRVNEQQTVNGIRMSEVYLNRIEALVRTGGAANITEALGLLDQLRKKRYDITNYESVTTTDQTALLKEVLVERRRELRFTCFSWFDMKRLNTDEATRTNYSRKDQNGNTITLEWNSPRYVWAIPLDVIEQNPQLTQNPR